MPIIKPSNAFKQSADWVSAEVRAYMKDQVSTHVDTVQDVRDNDFEKSRFIFVKSLAATFRLDLSSGADDDGINVLHDNIGRRYLKVIGTGLGGVDFDAQVADLAGRAAYDDEAEGFKVLVSDVGDGRAAIYSKDSGASADWSDPAYVTGPQGSTGDIGGVAFQFDDGTADANPGAGNIRANNADLSAATTLFVSKTNRYGDDLSAFLASLVDSTSSHKGYLTLTAPDSETQATFSITGLTDASGYVKLTVSGHSGATSFVDAERLAFQFSRTGNAGDLNGVTPGTTGLAVLGAETQAEAQTALDVYSRTEVDRFFDYITPAMFGAVGDGIEDDTTALQNMLSDGRPVEWGGASKTYRITSGLSVVPSDPVIWRSRGASIVLDSGSSIQTAVMVNTPGHDVDVIGRLRLDCQQKAFIGFFFQNSSGTFCDFSGKGLQVRNVYRASTAFTGGDGIWIRGGFRNIYLERPDVRGVLMANGAGVSGSQGVTGISVTAMTLSPQEVTIVHPWVEGVYSEDASYLVDQDGIKIFGAEDDDTVVLFEGHFSLFGGKIRNCGGRSVKSQMEYGQIVGTQFSRDGVEVSEIAREGSMPEIDFQTGGGLVENIECNYRGSAPNRIVQLTGSRQDTPIRYSAGAKVDGIRISRTGSYQLDSLVDIAPKFMRSGIIDIKNINQTDSNLLKSHAIRIGDEPTNSATLLVNVENLNARVNSASSMKIVNVSRTVGTTHLVGRNVWSTQSGTSFAATAGGTITQTLEGKNINVT